MTFVNVGFVIESPDFDGILCIAMESITNSTRDRRTRCIHGDDEVDHCLFRGSCLMFMSIVSNER
jgi:hypothetical protein